MPDLNKHLLNYPDHIISALARQARQHNTPVYFAGGPVRDWLLGEKPTDLDITVPDNSFIFAKALARDLQGTLVPLSATEGIARVVSNKLWLDISSYRDGTNSIEDDLRKRDFTINAMAVAFDACTYSLTGDIIDPTSGLDDLQSGIIRTASNTAFLEDPLRLLRAFRFMACLKFRLATGTRDLIKHQAALIHHSAGERQAYELDKIMTSVSAGKAVSEMAAVELLWQIFPELIPGVGMAQPASHHLDVFGHNLETLKQIEKIIAAPGELFPEYLPDIEAYLGQKGKISQLKFAALFHDLGKPQAFAIKNGRQTFYNHDQLGVKLLSSIAKRLKWSTIDRRTISLLVKHHMRPFHLNNAKNKTGITSRACLKLIKAIGDELIGLFLLAMADSLAGCGPGKPAGMEDSLVNLFDEIYQVNRQILQPVLKNPLLLNGHDLILLGQKPGPLFGRFFRELEILQINNPEISKAEALQWATDFFNNKKY